MRITHSSPKKSIYREKKLYHLKKLHFKKYYIEKVQFFKKIILLLIVKKPPIKIRFRPHNILGWPCNKFLYTIAEIT
jgi:hypothetical protein